MKTTNEMVEARREAYRIAMTLTPAGYEPLRRSYFAPNFRCTMNTHVEIPDGWEKRYEWDGSDDIRQRIESMIAVHGQRCHVFEGRGQKTWLNKNGWVIPIPVWDAEMGQYIGIGVVGGTEAERNARLANPPYVDYAPANAVIDAAYSSMGKEVLSAG